MGIYVNEVGYYRFRNKKACVTDAKRVSLYDIKDNLVKTYNIESYSYEELSGEKTAVIDFSNVTEEGTYYFCDNNGVKSCYFKVTDNPYNTLATAALKMFYYQRCGIELTSKYAGAYTHKVCHIKPVNYIYGSEKFDCTGGWHDAGDFGRYVTAGAVAVAHLLYAYKLNPDAFSNTINIPESGNGVPDILNECRYELEWLLKMQTENGGVYHKCTSMHHADFIMPEDDDLDFIVTNVSSIATADFAAVCALASRVYLPFDASFSGKLKKAALKADEWLDANPNLVFNESIECSTGGYGDLCDLDERLWALTELYRVNPNKKYLAGINTYLDMNLNFVSLGWMDVAGLAGFCVLTDDNIFPEMTYNHFKCAILDEADRLVNTSKKNVYEVAMHPYNFKWGSNMVLLTGAMILCFADNIAHNEEYTDTILSQLDYLLGKNAMNVSYVTGFGDNSFKNPHNRPTAEDNILEPIPGYVSGGPNFDHCDADSLKKIPKGTAPMKCYLDDVGSYSTNEITIYWNSPLVYILAYLSKAI